MPTPYDNHDGGFTREDYRIAADYGVDLDAPAQVRCGSCFQYRDADELIPGICAECVTLMRSEQSASFLTAPTLAGCINLMAPVNEAGRLKWATLLAHESAIVAAIPVLEVGNDN